MKVQRFNSTVCSWGTVWRSQSPTDVFGANMFDVHVLVYTYSYPNIEHKQLDMYVYCSNVLVWQLYCFSVASFDLKAMKFQLFFWCKANFDKKIIYEVPLVSLKLQHLTVLRVIYHSAITRKLLQGEEFA